MKIPFKLRILSALAASAVVALIASSAQAEQVALVNFGNTAYMSDGVNTWQTFDLNGAGTTFVNVPSTALLDKTGVASGLTITITGVINGGFNSISNASVATQAKFDAPTSGTKPSWFDSSSAQQRDGFRFFSYDVTYTISGFSASDTVQFDYVVGSAALGGGATRNLTLTRPAGPTTLLNAVSFVSESVYYATLPGLTGATSYSFLAKATGTSTAALVNALAVTRVDATKPTLTGTNPADNATGVLTSSNLVATFSEPVIKGTGNIELRKTVGDVLVESFDVTTAPSARITYSGATVTIDPTSNLNPGVEYYVLIPATAVKDGSNNFYNGISATTAWSFTTDATPPAVISMAPLANATGVLPSTDLTLNFSETVLKNSGDIVIRLASNGSEVQTISVTDAAVTVAGSKVTINIADLALGVQYYVEIAAGAFTDLSGNAHAGISGSSAWSFTTVTSLFAHHYTFDSNANDSAGSANGTLVGDAFVNTGGSNPAGGGYLDLDGTGDWVSLGSSILTPAGSTSTQPVTISGWVRFDANVNAVLYSEFGGISDYRYTFGTNASTNKISLDQFPPSGGGYLEANAAGLGGGQWHHVAYTQDPASATKRRLFLDGIQVGSSTVIEDYTGTTPTSVLIGARGDLLVPINGAVDDMAFWHGPLTVDAMKGLYDVAKNATLGYDAGRFNQLKEVHDAGSGSVTIGGLEWTYATGLGNTAGLSGTTPTFALVLDATAGTGLTSNSVSPYNAWANGYLPANNVSNKAGDNDGDTLTNLQEFAFGTNPTVSYSGPILYDLDGNVTTPGSPVATNFAVGSGVDFRAVFGRRKDYVTAGLTYTVQFSAGLDVWVNSAATPTRLTGASSTGDIDAYSVPYPLFITTARGVEKPTFFRVAVTSN